MMDAAALDLVDWPSDRTLALSGPADALRLPLTLRNPAAGVRSLSEISLSDLRLVGGGPPLRLDPVPVGLHVVGGGMISARLRLRLPPSTPPGRYEGKIQIGELTRAVAIEVVAETKLGVRPAPVVVDAGSGQTHRFAGSFENRGNVGLTLDLSGTYPLGEEVRVAPKAADDGRATEDRLGALLDRLTGRGETPILVPFGSAELRQPGGPLALAPGETRVVSLELALPGSLSATARYHLYAPVYATDLHVVIVTAAKSATPPRAPRRAKGAVA
jgi:hypothetical protein